MITVARFFEDPWWLDFAKRIIRLPLKAIYYSWLRLHPDYPWLTYGAIRWLKRHLHPSMVGFEWGSGRSTLFFAQRVHKLYTVEHDRQWYETVRQMIQQAQLQDKVELILIPPHKPAFDPAKPRTPWWAQSGYVPGKPQYAQYADAILQFPDAFFDFIVVDGRERVSCLLNAEPKLKPGGFLLLDNAERREYQPGILPYRTWRRLDFSNGLTISSIFLKPSQDAGAKTLF